MPLTFTALESLVDELSNDLKNKQAQIDALCDTLKTAILTMDSIKINNFSPWSDDYSKNRKAPSPTPCYPIKQCC